jgi:hypothetical protein
MGGQWAGREMVGHEKRWVFNREVGGLVGDVQVKIKALLSREMVKKRAVG